MATTSIDLTHPVHVLCDDRTDGLGYRAACGCGWAGAWQSDQTDAEADALDHREVAVGPADGLDRAMGELLDFQDDLAAVVVWLAENWSADLPTPDLYGYAQAGLELWVYTSDLDTLARIAHLLGVPARDDEHPNAQGNRYRNARRAFGRVGLRAFAPLRGTQEMSP